MIRITYVRKYKTHRGPRRGHHRRVRTHVTIPKLERQVLTSLANYHNYPVEMGGGLDFDKHGRLERIHVQKGTAASIDLPPDFEVQYHTHPSRGPHSRPASPEDVQSLLHDKAQQAELVVRPGVTDILVKSPSIRALSRLPATRLFSKLDRAYTRSQRAPTEADADKQWHDELRKLGLHVRSNTKTGPLRLHNVRPVEPPRRARGAIWD